jgi:peptidoglycan/LPS O-acetylase OafA/YrhL
VSQIADRVDALGGDSNKVAPSGSGQWREAYRRCLLLNLAAVLLIAMLIVGIGVLPGGLAAITATPLFALLIGAVYLWTKRCRPKICQKIRTLLAGTGLGAIILALFVLFGLSTPQLITTFIVSAGLTASTAIVSWVKGCFK